MFKIKAYSLQFLNNDDYVDPLDVIVGEIPTNIYILCIKGLVKSFQDVIIVVYVWL